MMNTVFSKAADVFVYLREKPKAFEEFLCAAEALKKLGPDNIKARMFNDPNFPEVLTDLRVKSPAWDAFNDIVSRSWYRRAWTVQEFVLVQIIKMCIGDFAIDHADFRDVRTNFEWFHVFVIGRVYLGTERQQGAAPSLDLICKKA